MYGFSLAKGALGLCEVSGFLLAVVGNGFSLCCAFTGHFIRWTQARQVLYRRATPPVLCFKELMILRL